MIGIVIVSHSEKLAEGIRDLAEQMVQGQLSLATAGGIDDPENPIGTDAFRVQKAIESVFSEEGVLVLMDMGSALLSTEMALEFLTEEQKKHVYLCEAPLVEGTIAATVQATISNDIEEVIAEARNALIAKKKHLSDYIPEISATQEEAQTQSASHEIKFTVHNPHGLHARPAAKLVRTAARFQAQIMVRKVAGESQPVNAKSFGQITTLGVEQGDEIAIVAHGSDAETALAALETLAEENFGEEAPPSSDPDSTGLTVSLPKLEGELAGTPVSPGIAIGPAITYRPAPIEATLRHVEDSAAEWNRFQNALKAAQQKLENLHRQAMNQMGTNEAAIFEAHRLLLEDEDLIEAVRQRIFEQAVNAETAWQEEITQLVAQYESLEDSYQQERAKDIADVSQRVLRLLTGRDQPPFELSEPAVLIAADLTPSDTVQLNSEYVLGICTELGSATSHSAILARSLGIPAVVGVGSGALDISDQTLVALDGEAGRVWIQPEDKLLSRLRERRQIWLAAQKAALDKSHQPAQTRDGHRVEVAANIGGIGDAYKAIEMGAEGVGLLRTEFLYLERLTAPSEEEQTLVYQAIAKAVGVRPLIIRTLDIGGDKPVPYLELTAESNPFLGWRGIRISLDQPETLKTQLRAILRASPGYQFKIMFPMVASVTEVREAKAILVEVQNELQEAKIPFEAGIEIGIMIEVPAAVAVADQLAAEVDFFSIGTNDLSQYTMAADRTNIRVGERADAFHPAVLRLIQKTIETAHQAGIWVGLCGELAGNPLATPILLGLGLDEFSMSAPLIPAIKQAMAHLITTEAQEIAEVVLQLDSAEAVRTYLKEKTEDKSEFP